MSDSRLDELEQRIERIEKYTGMPVWWKDEAKR